MNRCHFILFIGFRAVLAALLPASVLSLLRCTETPDVTLRDDPAGKRYVAYRSFDPYLKPDTVRASWDVAGIALSDVSVEISLDSGMHWFAPVDSISRSGSKVALNWVPGKDSLQFSYFGEREVTVRLTTATGITNACAPFTVIGAIPVVLETPQAGASFSLDDTITLIYHVNTDRISRVRSFFAVGGSDDPDWREFTDSTKLLADDIPFQTFQVPFIPAVYNTFTGSTAAQTVRFLLKDYNSPLSTATVVSGDITITP